MHTQGFIAKEPWSNMHETPESKLKKKKNVASNVTNYFLQGVIM